jgi:hypothetical protein
MRSSRAEPVVDLLAVLAELHDQQVLGVEQLTVQPPPEQSERERIVAAPGPWRAVKPCGWEG